MYEVTEIVNSEELKISFSLPCRDWSLLERSKLWKRLNRYRKACLDMKSELSGKNE